MKKEIIETTQKNIRNLSRRPDVIDLTDATMAQIDAIREQEHYFTTIALSAGIYGLNGLLMQGTQSLKLYAVTKRCRNIFLF